MTMLTPAAFFALATACSPGLDARMLLVQAQRESSLDTAAIHQNSNGTTDYGLMQINSSNFPLLGLRSTAEALDPCRNLRAAADLYKTLSRYNSGSPTASIAYAHTIISATRMESAAAPTSGPGDCPPVDRTGWHVVALPAQCIANADWHTTKHEKEVP